MRLLIAVITYTFFLNSRSSVGRYEVKNVDRSTYGSPIFKVDRITGKTWALRGGTWIEFPTGQISNPPKDKTEAPPKEQTSPPPKEQGKAEPPAVSDDQYQKGLYRLETALTRRYPGKVQADCKDLASVVREIYPEASSEKVDDVTLATRVLQMYPELKWRVRCDDATSAATKK
jgi:hypothetical protein